MCFGKLRTIRRGALGCRSTRSFGPVFCLFLLVFSISATGFGLAVTSATLQPDMDSHYRKSCVAPECHPVEPGGRTPKHPPYLEGHCLPCHLDHSATGTALLKTRNNSMCLQCHGGLEIEKPSETVKHPPDTDLCTQCHNPHESRVRNLLRDEKFLSECAQCHEPFLKKAAAYPYRHEYFDPKTQCGSCHYAHQQSAQRYVRENVAESCLTCHDLPIESGGRKLENIAESLATLPFVHKAMEKGSCPACHTPHGSDQPSLLESGYPAGSYDVYNKTQYALCWKCHKEALVENPNRAGVTGFRNGTENLHWFHVAKLKRGRACHLCHAAHASQQPRLMREKVLFRKWYGTILYTATESGGSCLTPCHDQREYRRSP